MPKNALVIGVVLIMSLLIIYYSLREARKKKPGDDKAVQVNLC